MLSAAKNLEALAKPQSHQNGHAERSEEFRIFKDLRSFAAFRMTKKPGLQ
jgi:hypothetical protein